jgi:TolA-binding protein
MLGSLLIALAVAASPATSPKAKTRSKAAPAKKAPAPAPAPAVPAPPQVAPAATATPEKRDVLPGQKPKLALEGMGRTAEEQKQLDALQDMLRSYEEESRDFKRDVQLLVEKKYEEKRSDLASSYEKAIRDLEVNERKDRLDAIAQFEEFLQRYPDEPRYTPDVMFRLAELYYERSADDHAVAMRAYEDQLKRWTPRATPRPRPSRGGLPALHRPLPAAAGAVPEVQVQRRDDVPARLLPGEAERLRGCPAGLPRRHRRLPEEQVRHRGLGPDRRVLLRRLRRPGRASPGGHAYEHAIKDTRSPLYDKALYKLGWTYYRQDRFEPAVQRFLELVDTTTARRCKKDGKITGDLRGEALQYTAISFADEKWGSVDKAKATFARMGGRPYEAEVYRRWATSTSTRPATPTPSPPTAWRCSGTRWRWTRPSSSRRSSRPTSATGS